MYRCKWRKKGSLARSRLEGWTDNVACSSPFWSGSHVGLLSVSQQLFAFVPEEGPLAYACHFLFPAQKKGSGGPMETEKRRGNRKVRIHMGFYLRKGCYFVSFTLRHFALSEIISGGQNLLTLICFRKEGPARIGTGKGKWSGFGRGCAVWVGWGVVDVGRCTSPSASSGLTVSCRSAVFGPAMCTLHCHLCPRVPVSLRAKLRLPSGLASFFKK